MAVISIFGLNIHLEIIKYIIKLHIKRIHRISSKLVEAARVIFILVFNQKIWLYNNKNNNDKQEDMKDIN